MNIVYPYKRDSELSKVFSKGKFGVTRFHHIEVMMKKLKLKTIYSLDLYWKSNTGGFVSN